MQPTQYSQARSTTAVISSHAPLHSVRPVETPSFSGERPARSLMPRSTYSVTRSRNGRNGGSGGSDDDRNVIDNSVNVNGNGGGEISPLRCM